MADSVTDSTIEKDNINVDQSTPNHADNESIDRNSEYDPHLHRNVEQPTSNVQALVHLLKGCIDSSLLTLPHAFYFAGYVTGLVGIVIIGCLTWYSWLNLIRSKYKLCQQYRIPTLPYSRIMEKALEQRHYTRRLSFLAIPVIEGLLIVQQVGVCCVYSVFIPTHIKPVVDAHVYEMSINVHIVLMTIPSIFLVCIPSLKQLSPLTHLANFCSLIGVGVIFFYVLKDGLPSPSTRIDFGPADHVALFFSTALFSMNPVGIINSLENSMEKPKWFPKLIIIEIGSVAILNCVFGFLGYLKYGEHVKASIALNLPDDASAAQVTDLLFAISVLISYTIHAFVPIQIIWNRFMEERFSRSGKKIRLLWKFVLRLTFVFFTCGFALLIPFIDMFIAVVGSLTLSLLGLTFPALMAICVQKKFDLKTTVVNVIIMIIGVMSLIFGTYFSIRDIISLFKSPKS